MVKGASIIMLFYFLGECLSFLINGIVPGSVCGMVLLFLSLLLKLVKPRALRSVSNELTQNMELVFVRAGVGIMASCCLVSQ